MTWLTSLNLGERYNINYVDTVFSAIKLDQTSILLSILYSLLFLHKLIAILTAFVYLHVTIRIGWTDDGGGGGKKKAFENFWHSFQIRLNYACKDFQFGTWLENRLQRASIFPLASNPKNLIYNIKNILLPINKVLFTIRTKGKTTIADRVLFTKQKLTDARTGQAPRPWCDYL